MDRSTYTKIKEFQWVISRYAGPRYANSRPYYAALKQFILSLFVALGGFAESDSRVGATDSPLSLTRYEGFFVLTSPIKGSQHEIPAGTILNAKRVGNQFVIHELQLNKLGNSWTIARSFQSSDTLWQAIPKDKLKATESGEHYHFWYSPQPKLDIYVGIPKENRLGFNNDDLALTRSTSPPTTPRLPPPSHSATASLEACHPDVLSPTAAASNIIAKAFATMNATQSSEMNSAPPPKPHEPSIQASEEPAKQKLERLKSIDGAVSELFPNITVHSSRADRATAKIQLMEHLSALLKKDPSLKDDVLDYVAALTLFGEFRGDAHRNPATLFHTLSSLDNRAAAPRGYNKKAYFEESLPKSMNTDWLSGTIAGVALAKKQYSTWDAAQDDENLVTILNRGSVASSLRKNHDRIFNEILTFIADYRYDRYEIAGNRPGDIMNYNSPIAMSDRYARRAIAAGEFPNTKIGRKLALKTWNDIRSMSSPRAYDTLKQANRRYSLFSFKDPVILPAIVDKKDGETHTVHPFIMLGGE